MPVGPPVEKPAPVKRVSLSGREFPPIPGRRPESTGERRRGPATGSPDFLDVEAYNSHMRIHFERTGGFAGRKVQLTLDSTSLPPSQARHLRSLLARSHFFELPIRLRAQAVGPDRFHYRITVEENERSHTVEAAEAAVPAEMRPLLDWLTRLDQAR